MVVNNGMESRFENQEESEAERLTQEEATDVVRLWAEKQGEAPHAGSMTVKDLAEGLDIPPERARSLLEEVRNSRSGFKELPATFASSPPGSPLTAVTLFALGVLVVSLMMGAGLLSLIASVALVAALLASRRWGIAILATIAILIAFLFLARTQTVGVSTPAPAIEVPPPPAVPAPPLPPSPR